jgi:hypothetical protein
MVVVGANGFDADLTILGLDTLAPVDSVVSIPGSFVRTSAIAADGASSTVLVAREKVVYSVTYAPRSVQRLLTTSTTVLQLELSHPLAVAGCRSGEVIVFGSSSGVVLRNFQTFNNTAVKCLALHYAAVTLVVVDDTGAVEVVELPVELLRHAGGSEESMASARVLQRVVRLEESVSGAGALATARRAVADETLLLARLLIPRAVRGYLGAQHSIL